MDRTHIFCFCFHKFCLAIQAGEDLRGRVVVQVVHHHHHHTRVLPPTTTRLVLEVSGKEQTTATIHGQTV